MCCLAVVCFSLEVWEAPLADQDRWWWLKVMCSSIASHDSLTSLGPDQLTRTWFILKSTDRPEGFKCSFIADFVQLVHTWRVVLQYSWTRVVRVRVPWLSHVLIPLVCPCGLRFCIDDATPSRDTKTSTVQMRENASLFRSHVQIGISVKYTRFSLYWHLWTFLILSFNTFTVQYPQIGLCLLALLLEVSVFLWRSN